MTGSDDSLFEYVEAIKLAAEQGFAEAQYNLGVCYVEGIIVERDEEVAVEWFGRAAEQGVAEAQYNLGVCYAQGIGVEQDDEVAVEWLRRAAEQGLAEAQYNLGDFYAQGIGVEENLGKSFDWFSKAVINTNQLPLLEKVRHVTQEIVKSQLGSHPSELKEGFLYAQWGGLLDSVNQKIDQMKEVLFHAAINNSSPKSSEPKNSNDFN